MAKKIICPKFSSHVTERSEKWDAYFCIECNEWLEEKCSDVPLGLDEHGYPECDFNCWNRPEKPLDKS